MAAAIRPRIELSPAARAPEHGDPPPPPPDGSGARRSGYHFDEPSTTVLLLGAGGVYHGRVELRDSDTCDEIGGILEQLIDAIERRRGGAGCLHLMPP
jgi:hypothetical protein